MRAHISVALGWRLLGAYLALHLLGVTKWRRSDQPGRRGSAISPGGPMLLSGAFWQYLPSVSGGRRFRARGTRVPSFALENRHRSGQPDRPRAGYDRLVGGYRHRGALTAQGARPAEPQSVPGCFGRARGWEAARRGVDVHDPRPKVSLQDPAYHGSAAARNQVAVPATRPAFSCAFAWE